MLCVCWMLSTQAQGSDLQIRIQNICTNATGEREYFAAAVSDDGFVVDTTARNISGTTTETVLSRVKVPAGTYAAGDLIIVNALWGKTGSAGTFTHKLWASPNDPSSSGTSGAIQLWTRGTVAGNLYIDHGRHLYIKNASGGGSGIELGTELAATGTALFSEMRSSTTSNVAINWTNDVWVFCTGQLASSADRISQYYLKIWEY